MKDVWQEVPDGTKYADGAEEGQIIDSTEWGDIKVIDGTDRLVRRRKNKRKRIDLPEPLEYARFQWERTAICLVGIYIILMIVT